MKKLFAITFIASILFPAISFAARGFGNTLGSNTSDQLTVGHNSSIDNLAAFTVSISANRNGDGGDNDASGKGRMLHKADVDGIGLFILLNNGPGTNYQFIAGLWATPGIWSFARPATGSYHSIIVTYDYSLAANNPTIYVDGSSVSATIVQAPVGSKSTDSADLIIGNRQDNNRNWNGCLEKVGIWNRILTAGERMAVNSGLPTDVSSGLVASYLLTGTDSPEADTSGNGHSATVSGTALCTGSAGTTTTTTTVAGTTTTVATTTTTTIATTTTTTTLPSSFTFSANFRFTICGSAFGGPCVNDGTAQYVLPGDVAPVARLNGGGFDQNARPGPNDGDNTNEGVDVKFAGYVFATNGTQKRYIVTGYPYPASYNINCLMGDQANAHPHQYLKIEDQFNPGTPYITLDHTTDGGTAAGNFWDCSNHQISTGQAMTAATVTINTASIVVVIGAPTNTGGASTINHFDMSLAGAAPTTTTTTGTTVVTTTSTTTTTVPPPAIINPCSVLFWSKVTKYADLVTDLPGQHPDGYLIDVYYANNPSVPVSTFDTQGQTATPATPNVTFGSFMGGLLDGSYVITVRAYLGTTSNASGPSAPLSVPTYQASCVALPTTTTTTTTTLATTTTTTTTTTSTTGTTLASGPDVVEFTPLQIINQPAALIAGAIYNLFYDIKNIGSSSTGAFHVGIYMGGPGQLSGPPTPKDVPISTLTAGTEVTGTIPFLVPANLSPGVYTLLLYLDNLAEISAEKNINNNFPLIQGLTVVTVTTTTTTTSTTTTTVTGLADLTTQAPILPPQTTVVAGTQINIGIRISNGGAASTVNGFKYGFFLSTNTTCGDGDDVFLGAVTIPAIGIGGNPSYSFNVPIPIGTAQGHYNICGFADYLNTIPENNEGNNEAVDATHGGGIDVIAGTTTTTLPPPLPCVNSLPRMPFRNDPNATMLNFPNTKKPYDVPNAAMFEWLMDYTDSKCR